MGELGRSVRENGGVGGEGCDGVVPGKGEGRP